MNKYNIIISFLWKFAERTSVQGISFIVSICLARLLQPSEYGEIALVMVFINIANIIVDGGFNTSLIQAKKADAKDFSTIFYTTLFVAIVSYIILFTAAPMIAKFYDKANLCSVVRVISLCLVAYAINSIQRAYISKNMQFKKLFYSNLLATIGAGAGNSLSISGIWYLGISLSLHCFSLPYVLCHVFDIEMATKSLFFNGLSKKIIWIWLENINN